MFGINGAKVEFTDLQASIIARPPGTEVTGDANASADEQFMDEEPEEE